MSLDFKLKILFIINVHNKMKLLRSFESIKEVFVLPLGEYTFHPGHQLIKLKQCREPEEGGTHDRTGSPSYWPQQVIPLSEPTFFTWQLRSSVYEAPSNTTCPCLFLWSRAPEGITCSSPSEAHLFSPNLNSATYVGKCLQPGN